MGKTHKNIDVNDLGNTNGSICAAIIEEPVTNEKVTAKLARMESEKEATLATLSCYGREAIEKLAELMRSADKDDVQFKAAVKILEYTVGKPAESKPIEPNKKSIPISDNEFEEIIEDGDEEKLQKMIESKYGKTNK